MGFYRGLYRGSGFRDDLGEWFWEFRDLRFKGLGFQGIMEKKMETAIQDLGFR